MHNTCVCSSSASMRQITVLGTLTSSVVTAVAGVNVPYHGESEPTCRSKCTGCSTPIFNPVCGSDGLTYTSFCDAGCVEGSDTEVNTQFNIYSIAQYPILYI